MIVAARTGPTPKIWVRVVPEACTSATMRSFRSVIFLFSVRTSRSTSEAKRRRRRAEAPLGRMPRRMRAARSAESFPLTPPGTRSRKSACRRFNALVRSATRSSLLSERSRSASEPTSGSTAASLSLREAANAIARASTPSFLRALPLESTLTLAESLGGTSTTDSPAAANLPARCRPRPPAFSTAQRRSANLLAQRSRDLRPARFCGKLARSRNSPVASSTAATATEPLWGSTPIKTFMSAHTSVSVGPSPSSRAKDIPTSGLCSHTSFESLRAGYRRDASLEQANPSYGRQEVRERSLYDRHPRSLATLETTELLSRVKQVGSSQKLQ